MPSMAELMNDPAMRQMYVTPPSVSHFVLLTLYSAESLGGAGAGTGAGAARPPP